MAILQQPFNALQFNPEMGMSSLPLGLKQPVRIVASEVKAAKENNNNGMASFTVEILDGDNKGAQGNINFNIYNSNGDAARIAHDHLAAMSYAIGIVQWQNTEQLHNMPFLIDVTPQKVKAGQEDKGYTEVSAYYDQHGNKPKRGQIPGQQAQGNGQQGNGGQAQGNWNTGGQQQGQQVQQTQQQDPNAGQQQQNGNFNNNNQQQQQGNFGGGNNGQQQDQNQNQNNGQQQQQFNNNNQQQSNSGQAAWNTGGGNAGNAGNNGGGAPWSKQG